MARVPDSDRLNMPLTSSQTASRRPQPDAGVWDVRGSPGSLTLTPGGPQKVTAARSFWSRHETLQPRPNFGLVVSDGTRVSCPPGGYIEVGETQGQRHF